MTAAAARWLDLDAFRAAWDAFAEMIRTVWDGVVRALRPLVPVLRRLGRVYAWHGRGPHASPQPLAIDGHAYHRRLRARLRR